MNTGIYFESIGTIQTYYETWEIKTAINKTEIEQNLEIIKRMTDELRKICDMIKISSKTLFNMSKQPYCVTAITQIENLIEDLPNPKTGNLRKNKMFRRFIPLIVNFGSHANEIRQLREQNIEFKDLINEQTTYIRTITQNNNLKLEKFEKLLNLSLTRNDKLTELSFIEQEATKLIHHILLALSKQKEDEELILNEILVKLKIQSIISPIKMLENLKRVEDNLDIIFPIKPTIHNIQNFYSFSEISLVSDNNLLMITVTVPIVHKYFDLYKPLVIPTKTNLTNTFRYTDISLKYFAITRNNSYFFPLTTQELMKCHTIFPQSYICKQTFHMFPSSNTNICEIDIFTTNQLTKSCKANTLETPEFWVEFFSPGKLIFSTYAPQNISIWCEDQNLTREVKNTNIITIPSFCSILTKKIRIFKQTNIGHSEFTFSLNKVTEFKSNALIIKKDDEAINIIREFQNKIEKTVSKIKESEDKLQQIRSKTDYPKTNFWNYFQSTASIPFNKTNSIFSFSIFSTSTIIIIVLIIYIYIRSKRDKDTIYINPSFVNNPKQKTKEIIPSETAL